MGLAVAVEPLLQLAHALDTLRPHFIAPRRSFSAPTFAKSAPSNFGAKLHRSIRAQRALLTPQRVANLLGDPHRHVRLTIPAAHR